MPTIVGECIRIKTNVSFIIIMFVQLYQKEEAQPYMEGLTPEIPILLLTAKEIIYTANFTVH